MGKLTDEELELIKERIELAKEDVLDNSEVLIARYNLALEDAPKLLEEIKHLYKIISWGLSCVGCSNQLAEEWDIIDGSFVCQECIDYGE